MESASFTEEVSERKVCIVGSELVENYTAYIIEVTDGEHRWTVKHRYSDFHDLHEKLTVEKKVDRHLLPPKKMLGKNSRSLVERRQKELELYLQTLLLQFPQATPTPLTSFLHFHLYEINGITAALAEELFHKGEQLLQAGQVFSLSPLQLYSVSQQLRLAKPTCCNGDAKTDLGHILDFTCRLRYLKISGTRGPVGTSNIQENSLPFDLSVFKSLLQIEIRECWSNHIGGLSSLRPTVETLSIHGSTDTMMSILVPESREFSQWEAEGAESGCPVTAVIPVWRKLTTLDMSHNNISCIDSSVKLIPKVEFLDLSHNQLSSVENLQHLYNLVNVDLSYNNLWTLEAAHTCLGNIKTMSLAGNQLDSLSGLTKLYSLVNLDLSHNQLTQLVEIRNIGSLPCLEKLNLSSNPMCIIPDYRTKVLAQFGDRAAEVCLDGKVTTEKELDTVEVLKAIQKAKEVKDRMSSSDKKISEESMLSAPPSHLGSSSSSDVAPPAVTSSFSSSSSSCVAQLSASPSQDVTNREETAVYPSVLPPAEAPPPAPTRSNTNIHHLSVAPTQIQHCDEHTQRAAPTPSICGICSSSSSKPADTRCSLCSAPYCPLLSQLLLSLSFSNKDFISQLSWLLRCTLMERKNMEEEEREKKRCDTQHTDLPPEEAETCPSPGSRDGYFEMDLGDSVEEPLCSSSTSPSDHPAEEHPGPQGALHEEAEDPDVHISSILWCYCVQVDEEVEQRKACLVLTDQWLGLLYLSHEVTWTIQQADQDGSVSVDQLLSGLQVHLLLPYSQMWFSSDPHFPDLCLAFGLQSGVTRWYLFSEAGELSRIRTALIQVDVQAHSPSPLLPPSLFNSWEVEESHGAQRGYCAFVLPPPSQDPRPLLSDILPHPDKPYLPSLLFLTHRHLWVVKVDFNQLAEHNQSSGSLHPSTSTSSWCRLVRLPLGSVILQVKDKTTNIPCSDQRHHQRWSHAVTVMLGGWRLLLLFTLSQDRSSFVGELSQYRASLGGLKVVALPQPCRTYMYQQQHTQGGSRSREQCCFSKRGPGSSSWDSSCLQMEVNHPLPHLHPGLSPGLKLLAGLDGQELLAYFHRYIAQTQVEELRQVLWLSVVLYTCPEVELTCCLLLSTGAIYFLLEDSASTLSHHSGVVITDCGDPDICLCCCLSINLSELLSVNVGLFDQYFRVVGRSADHIICCLSRDSYGTGLFLQELMSVLSLLQQLPPPEPSELDFYSQFTSTATGKMHNYELVHSSRVKFIYPSEEEMGDLTFIVAERKTPATVASSSSHSFNILLYLLVFQVKVPGQGSGLSGPSPLAPGSAPSPVLQPRTLILTSSDVFLLDEDYISYPLPDFAKEPPSRERYQLREARRIRDLDRVLLGYQTYPQALTLVFDDLPGPDLLCQLTMDHFAAGNQEETPPRGGGASGRADGEVQWCVFVPGADSRERLISLLARQWEALCSRELPVELTG
ncbi:nischarin isoform X2 [Sphaeramia orbicularis]|uniref:nischarin isoform X2 n=1 Tax=Sphaeramia orbicularis TaxID=375764 RepID=UPI00117C13C5|nr:nischarin isoform X2 [Sphaeramia orbicularis]